MFEKRRELDNELLANFNPYLTVKSVSFYDDGLYASYVNDTLNTYGHIFKSEEDKFKFFENVIPISKKKRINYLKKEAKIIDKPAIPAPVPEFYSRKEWDRLTKMEEKLNL